MKKILTKILLLVILSSSLLPTSVNATQCASDNDDDSDGICNNAPDYCCKTPAPTESCANNTTPPTGCPCGATMSMLNTTCAIPPSTTTNTPVVNSNSTNSATNTPVVSSGSTTLEPPYSSYATDPKLVIASILQVLLGIVGAATLLMFIWGGFKLIFSEGNEDDIKKGRDVLVWATIGLAVIMASYSILSYTFTLLQKAATGA